MKFLFLIILNIIPQLISCNQDSSSKTKKMPPSIKEKTFDFVKINSYLLFFAFIIVFALQPCFVSFEDSYAQESKPQVFNIVIHSIAFALIFSVSICYFYGAATTIPKYDTDISSFLVTKLFNNISKYDFHCNNSSYSLKKMTIDYNDIFSNKNTKYQTALNNIYNNEKTSNYLKVSMRQMEKSKNTIISEIISFTNEYKNFSQSIHSYIKQISEKNFNDKPIIFDSNTDNTINNVGSKSYYSSVSYVGSIILGLIILLVSVFYLVIFFIVQHWADVFLCLFPLFAIGIITGGTLSGIYLSESQYSHIYYRCSDKYTIHYKANDIIFQNFNSNDNIFNFLNKKNEIKFQKLYESINSETIHKNYIGIYKQYSQNIEYRKDLNEILSTIKQNEKQLKTMKILFKEISDFSFS